MYTIGNCKGTKAAKEERRKELRDRGRDGDEMTSANRRENSALRQTDVRDGELEKSLTFSSEGMHVMCEQSFIDIRLTLDHTEREKVEKCFFQPVLDSQLHIYSPLLFLPPSLSPSSGSDQ